MPSGALTCSQFLDILVTQAPVYDKLILQDIRPEDGWIGHVETGSWASFTENEHTYDRVRAVYANPVRPWERVQSTSCVGSPCDPDENLLGMGNDRYTYFKERQSWASQIFCFDQMIAKTKAKESIAAFVSDTLKPATSSISSGYIRRRAADNAGKKWLAGATQADFTYTWDTDADGNEVYIDTSGTPTSLLTAQMLQRRVDPLKRVGYLGKLPFKDMPASIELVTDDDTLWNLDKATADSYVKEAWRFQQWKAANEYYKYNFSGQIGDFVVRVDPFPLRFNKVSTNRFQLVLPYKNIAAGEGIRSVPNDDFDNAWYQFSFIWHRRAGVLLTATLEAVNPMMSFAVRSLGGQWQFVTNDLGCENKRRNKGQFIADFVYGWKPQYTEFSELIFHMRQRPCVTAVSPCGSDPGYPAQDYDSENDPCTPVLYFTPVADGSGNYVIAEDTVTCNGVPSANAAISQASLANLVIALNADAATGAMGTWAVDEDDETQITLTDSTCTLVTIPWVV